MGGFLAKLSVSALDVRLHPHRADQRRVGRPVHHGPCCSIRWRIIDPNLRSGPKAPTCVRTTGDRSRLPRLITLYFFRQNLLGIHESSGKALKIMIATTVMAVVILVWCGVTL